MPRLTAKHLALLACLIGWHSASIANDDVPAIAAASSLNAALTEISERFSGDDGAAVKLSFASSGNLYRQIVQGAPFQLFFSADEAYVQELAQAGLSVDNGALYAFGRIVLFAPHGAPYAVDPRATGLKAALTEDRVGRFAIANPEHAPYGQAAREALQALGLWASIKPLLVLGENISQAAQFAVGGSTQGGLFAYSLALLPSVGARGDYVLLPDHLHRPLRQRMVLLKDAGATARRFFRYVQQPSARAIFERHGFTMPDP